MIHENRVDMLTKSFSNAWTDEDKREVEESLIDFKGLDFAKTFFKEKNMRKYTCCICGCDFYDQTGANPDPIMDGGKYSCCHDCDTRFVLPMRLHLSRKGMS